MLFLIGQTLVMKATDLLHIASISFGKTGTWEGVTGGLCHHVPRAPLGISFPVLMEYTKGINHSEL